MIAIFGGSFDPIHEGHLYLAQQVLAKYDFEKIYFVPAQKNPLKPSDTIAPAELRRQMVEKALAEANEPRYELLDFEIKRNSPSYTVLTVESLIQQGEKDLAILMGNDTFLSLKDWHQVDKLMTLVNMVVVTREKDWDLAQTTSVLQTLHLDSMQVDSAQQRITHSSTQRWVENFSFGALPYSASTLREEISKKWRENTQLDIPPQGIQRSVWQVIKENRLYAVSSSD